MSSETSGTPAQLIISVCGSMRLHAARVLLGKNPAVLRATKISYRFAQDMSWEQAAEYLHAKGDQTTALDPERGREHGLKQFLDDKTYKPGLGAYQR